MKRKRFKYTMVLIVSCFMIFAIAACSKSTNNEPAGTTAPTAEATSAPTAEATPAPTPVETVDPLEAYSPEITMTIGRPIPDGNKFLDGEDFNNNTWLNYMIKHTGVKTNVVWAVPQAQYDQKVNVIIASGDIPDLMQ